MTECVKNDMRRMLISKHKLREKKIDSVQLHGRCAKDPRNNVCVIHAAVRDVAIPTSETYRKDY